MVAPHAGMPVRRQPRRGKSRDAPACGQLVRDHRAPWPTTDGPTSLGADRALARKDPRHKLSAPRLQGRPRVPGPWRETPAVLAQADLPRMAPRLDGDRARVVTSTAGGGAHRWGRLASAPRRAQAPRTVAQPWGKDSAQAGNACQHLCRTACAGAADAPQALSPVAHG
jgi:hypothetical protein